MAQGASPESGSALALRARALSLDAERRRIADSLDAALLELGAAAEGSLVDAEGYPRTDLDVMAVRALRGRAACLRNDLAASTGEAERALLQLHACGAEALAALPPLQEGDSSGSGSSGGGGSGGGAAAPAPRRNFYLPLGVLATVAQGGPAEAGGLRAGDSVLMWGRLGPVLDIPGDEEEQSAALPALSALGAEAKRAAEGGEEMAVKVLRQGAALDLRLRPGAWSGAGCLGCLMVPRA